MRKIFLLFLLTLCLAIGQEAKPKLAYAEFIKDAFGVEVLCKGYSRVISLAPNLTEIVGYLGKSEVLVGVTDFCDYPPEVKKLPKVGGFINPSVEAVVALQPELVLAYRGNPLPVINKLKEVGITVFVLDSAKSLTELLRQMEDIAKLLCAEDDALEKLIGLRRVLEAHRKNLADSHSKPVILIFTNTNPPFYCAGKNNVHDSLIAYAGGVNGFPVDGYAQISPEAILSARPDIIIVPKGEGQDSKAIWNRIKRYPALFATDAVRNGRVLFFDEDVILRPGPRIFSILPELSRTLTSLREGS